MAIVFFCQGCGARFDVSDDLAGRKARCKKCGHVAAVPPANPHAAAAILTPRPPREAGSPRPMQTPRPAMAVAGGTGPTWLDEVSVSVGLAPITAENLKPVRMKAAGPLDNFNDDDGPDHYELASPGRKAGKAPPRLAGKPVGRLTRAWRSLVRTGQKPLRFINDTTYFLSIPFLMMILLGAIIHSRPLALLGATAVVLLNAGRLASGLANLMLIPFKDGIPQGVAFLFPPFGLYYLARNYHRLHKPIKRVAEPLLTVGLVFLAFALIPGLGRAGAPADAGIAGRMKAGAAALKRDMVDEVSRVRSEGLKAVGKEALGELSRNSRRSAPAPDPAGAGQP
ncbi:hypothetical protein EP7_000187 [Isosphaeraceae bacterium EP7]